MHAVPVSQAGASAAPNHASSQSASRGDDSFDFWDFLDIINPLQHIPIVNVLYREITGDEIGAAAKLIGGGLYGLGLLGGGWVSLASSAVDFAVEGATGEDIAGHVMDFVFGEDGAGGSETAPKGEGPELALSEEDAAVMAAVPRPPTVVVRSEGPSDTPRESLFGGAAAEEPATDESAQTSDELAALTGQAVSPQTGQALLLAAQAVGAGSEAGPRRMLAPGVVGFSLDSAQVQVDAGVTRNSLTGQLDVAVN